ncbi:hypothetical protein FA95DRAFT_1526764 [Auriscalpium vulgare]|uniref:Uncharacterized protein n=1 Tax=Auriscalpium vulgare TaxID=40419 RepID=A0ACB8RB85_9AGAM|nr:hypothetical protein FA95DRAFT_1526764 [Auriscalpium vulgare]
MVASSDRRLLWNPRGENKFLVGGNAQITLYEWSPEEPAIRHVTSLQDLQLMKSFAWSPDPTINDLLAIGLSSGRVDLLRLESTRFGRDHIMGRGPHVSLPSKASRAAISLAFCPVSPQYLASGFEKTRNDASLIIWDVHTATPSLSVHTPTPSTSSSSHIVAPPPSPARPIIPLPPPSRPHHPLPRTDVGTRSDPRILQAHAPGDSVHSVTWMPQSAQLIAACVSHRSLRLFDLRSSAPTAANVPTRVHTLATDPSDLNRLAAAGEGVVTIYDTRKLSAALLSFTPRQVVSDGARSPNASFGVSELEFSSVRRGLLATLEKDSSVVRLWNVLQTEAVDSQTTTDRPRSGDANSNPIKTPKLSWSNPTSMLPWTASTGSQKSQNPSSELPTPAPSAPYSLVLSDARKTKRFRLPIASFTLMPSSRSNPLTSSLMVLSKDGDLETTGVHDTPMHAPWGSRGTLAIAAGTTYRLFSGVRPGDSPPDPWSVVPSVIAPSSANTGAGTSPARPEEVHRGRSRNMPGGLVPTFGRGDEDGFPALNSPSAKPSPRGKPLPLPPMGQKVGGSSTPYHSLPASPRFRSSELPVSATFESGQGTPSPAPVSRRVSSALAKPAREKEQSRARSTGPGRARRAVDRIQGVVDDDISMVMRRRVISGYGLSNPTHNAILLNDLQEEQQNKSLVETWLWIDLSRRMLAGPASRFNGYNFSNQGLLGIWEGFPSSIPNPAPSAVPSPIPRGLLLDPSTAVDASQDLSRSRSRRGRPRTEVLTEFASAILMLGAYRQLDVALDATGWKPGVPTAKLIQRRFALHLCGWYSKDEDVAAQIDLWEGEEKQSRAACWLVFLGQHSKAVDLLLRSKDESHNMMSGTLAALAPSNTARAPELRQHYERLITRLDDPYFRAMLTYLALGDWADVLEEEALPLRERLAIALQFLEDDALTAYLRRVAEDAKKHGVVEGIIVTGLTSTGLDVLQSYVDRSGDVQTAAVLGAYVYPHQVVDERVKRWLAAYRDLLDGWKLFHHRSQFDIDRGQMLQELMQSGETGPVQLVQRQILIRCNYCNKVISAPQEMTVAHRATTCPFCNRPLPRCSVCLMNLSIVPDAVRDGQLAHHNATLQDTIDDAIVYCQTCRHGGHASHILEWFYGEAGSRSHGVCAVADCDHHCADEF